MTNENPFVRKKNSILRNGFSFIEFGIPFIRNAFSLQRNVKAFIMNEVPFVDFGIPFIRNVFSLQRKNKAFIMNGVSFIDFGFSFLSNGIIYSNKTDFLLDPVKRLLDYNRKITDLAGTQSDFNSVDPSISKPFPICHREIVNSVKSAFTWLEQSAVLRFWKKRNIVVPG
jgi:hypothetical protein